VLGYFDPLLAEHARLVAALSVVDFVAAGTEAPAPGIGGEALREGFLQSVRARCREQAC